MEWLLGNGMVLSLHKFIIQATEELRRARAVSVELSIRVHDHQLPSIESTKLLGLILNHNNTGDQLLRGTKDSNMGTRCWDW